MEPRPTSSQGTGGGCVYLYGPDINPPSGTSGSEEPMATDTPGGDTRNKDRVPISLEDALKSKALTVTGFDPRVFHNAVRHWTMRYDDTWTDPAQPMVRRGREVNLELTFDRPVEKGRDDLFFIMSADKEDNKPGKNLRAKFKVEEEGTEERSPLDWWAVVESLAGGSKKVPVRMHIPGNCAVGYWHLRVLSKRRDDLGTDSKAFVYVCSRPFTVLFNPWSAEDQVQFTDDPNLLEEYVLNDEGVVFMGTVDSTSAKKWHYGQFEDGVVDISLELLRKAFKGRMTQDMGDPVLVARALSRIVNAQDDNGVLAGKWTGDYSKGTHPTAWSSSLPILRQHHSTQKSVKFGQCWVFSHVLTTVCRALGLPCRSVTNFNSAHDTDSTCTVDVYLDTDGDIMEDEVKDSVWNFHVWNEVWILRPDLRDEFYKNEGYDGWHIIDATPQELSLGMMQCGPCPVKAVKRGEIAVGYDTAFIFSEVNAEIVDWVKGEEGDFDTVSDVRNNEIGCKISTLMPVCMKPETIPEGGVVRMDITGTYKHPEGSEEERVAVKRAVRYCRYGGKVFKKCSDLEVTFEPSTDMAIGSAVHLRTVVRNLSKEDREVMVTVAARSTAYWDLSRHSRLLAKQQFPKATIRAGLSERFDLTLKPETYMELCDEQWNIHGFACARDLQANMPYTSHRPFQLCVPELRVKGPASARSGEPVEVTVSLTNSLVLPVTHCSFTLDGSLHPAPGDPHPWVTYYRSHVLRYDSDFQVAPSSELTLKTLLTCRWHGETDKSSKTAIITFVSKELGALKGTFTLKRKTD